MEINPKLNLDAFEASFHAIDTHTVGEFTRIITSGFPKLEGDTMIERKNFLAKHYDKYRQALMFEPRGHHDMFGALLTDPIHPEADFGVIFMDTGEYLNMCGHGTIGSVTAIIETGLVPAEIIWLTVLLAEPEPAQSSPPFTKKVKSKLDSLSYMKALSALSSKA